MTEKMTRSEKVRRRLMDTAARLFYHDGIHATGIDRILAESGVAKMTLYKNYGSKDALVAEYLRERDEQWLPAFEEAVRGASRTPKGQLLAVFDILHDWLSGDGLRGCALLNAAVEFPDRDHPVRVVVEKQKSLLVEFLTLLGKEAGVRRPKQMAGEFMVLIHGAIAMHLISNEGKSALHAKRAAKAVLANEIPES